MVEAFLLGVISMASFTASLFFLKYWRQTRDFLFFAFAFFFFIEGINRLVTVSIDRPNEGNPLLYTARLIGLVFILVAILKKNYVAKRRNE